MAESLREILAEGEDVFTQIKREVSEREGCDGENLHVAVFREIQRRVGSGSLRLKKALYAMTLLGYESGEAESTLKRA